MDDNLSEYEKKRLATMAANAAIFEQLGLNKARDDMRPTAAPKAKRQKKEKPAAPTNRRAMRSKGLALDVEDDGNNQPEPVDEGLCTPEVLRSIVQRELEHPWMERLTDEQRTRLLEATNEETGWLLPFMTFTSQWGGKGEGPLNSDNMSKCTRPVMQLASGAGVTFKQRDGVFCENRPINLGVTAEQILQLRAEAQIWIPQNRAPADVIGMVVSGVSNPQGVVVDGVTVQKVPPPGPMDTSRGWTLNHPLKKVQQYCEHLDECEEMGYDATMSRLMGEEEWRAKKRAAAEAAATAAEAAAQAEVMEEEGAIAAVEGEAPFTMEMVREAVDMFGAEDDQREQLIDFLQDDYEIEAGAFERYGYVLEVMIGAVVAEAEKAKERGEGSSSAETVPA